MAKIKLAKIPSRRESVFTKLALFCHYYPQYKIDEAKKLPFKTLIQMLRVVQKKEAEHYLNLTQVFGNATDKKGYKRLIEAYKERIHG